ncbi:MAG: prolyl oligopeptidase family serine peptidase, partial [Planctomycetota bacterium]
RAQQAKVADAAPLGTAPQRQRSASYGQRSRGGVRGERISLQWTDAKRGWFRVAADDFRSFDIQAGTTHQHATAQSAASAAVGANAEESVQKNAGEASGEGTTKPAKSTASGDTVVRTDTRLPDVSVLPMIVNSRSGGTPCDIQLQNKTQRRLIVYWRDTAGDEIRYGDMQPGDSFSQSTYAMHTWVLRDAKRANAVACMTIFESSIAQRADRNQPLVGTVHADTPRPRELAPYRPPSARRGTTSPDGQYRIEIRDNNVYLRRLVEESKRSGKDDQNDWFQLSDDGTSENRFEPAVWWSPNSRYFVVRRVKRVQTRRITLVESAPRDQVQPKQKEINYAKPGDPLDVPRFYVGTVPTAATDQATSAGPSFLPIEERLYKNPYAVSRLRWHAGSQYFSFLYNQRGHQTLRLVRVDAADIDAAVRDAAVRDVAKAKDANQDDASISKAVGSSTVRSHSAIEETSNTFVCYSSKQFLHRIDAENQAIWMSERDGWNHLYVIDLLSGTVIRQLTRGPWVVRGVDRFDEQDRTLQIRVGGYYDDQDPYYIHHARVHLDTGEITMLTDGDGTHEIAPSPDGRWIIDRFSRVDLPPVTEIRDAKTGERVMKLFAADASELLDRGWAAPQRFVAPGRDRKTPIHGIIIRPSDFDPKAPPKKYPIIEAIYAGPHSAFVPKRFGRHGALYEMAELGFIVVKIDGMGTSHRNKAFHDVCWKNLGDSGFPDRVAWIRAAAQQHPEMDLSRIGIYGGSAGGQSALRALLAHGDFYHAAAADCGCHDNRMDKIWWNEQWMGYPIDPHYQSQSNVSNAKHLRGKLLLTVGAMDRNVDPASTMQVVQALIDADKDFDLIVFPRGGHGIGESTYGKRRRADFFLRALAP